MSPPTKTTQVGLRIDDREVGRADRIASALDLSRADAIRSLLPPSDDWLAVLIHRATLQHNGDLGECLYALAAEGLRAEMRVAGVAFDHFEPIVPGAVPRAWMEYVDAKSNTVGTLPPFTDELSARRGPPRELRLERGPRGLHVLDRFQELGPDGEPRFRPPEDEGHA